MAPPLFSKCNMHKPKLVYHTASYANKVNPGRPEILKSSHVSSGSRLLIPYDLIDAGKPRPVQFFLAGVWIPGEIRRRRGPVIPPGPRHPLKEVY